MATQITTRFASTSQPFHLADVRAWAILKASCGHQRGFFGEGPAALPVEPSCPSGPVLCGKEVARA